MSDNLIPFDFGDSLFRSHIDEDGMFWFVAKDVCVALGLGNSREAVRSLDDDELMSVVLTSGGQNRKMNVVSESGLYHLIFKSRKENAKKFRRWVTGEVIPSLRKNGCYSLPGHEPLALCVERDHPQWYSVIASFIQTHCRPDPKSVLTRGKVFGLYSDFCYHNNTAPVRLTRFFTALYCLTNYIHETTQFCDGMNYQVVRGIYISPRPLALVTAET